MAEVPGSFSGSRPINFRRRMRPMLGTFVEVGVPALRTVPPDTLIENAFLQVERVELLLNRHDPASELSRLNAARGEWVAMSRLSLRVLRLARLLMRASNGRFDVCLGSRDANLNLLVPGQVNVDGALDANLKRLVQSASGLNGQVNSYSHQIEIQNSRARIRDGSKISLDGIAKGFAVDLAIKSLKKSGAQAGWVNAGGDLRVFGDLELPVWRREADGSFKMLSHIRNAAFATSQSGDDSFPGKIEGHGGHQPNAGVWSVLAPTAWLADALTKVACVSSTHERADLIAKLGGHLVSAS